ncbi:interleukin-4 receptor subunit alpha [Sorex araneus]|uniref:interleukin-4 receptor subunit alpha n=1 Tax=Sorex araneus TaxID=42254 RepID=UPI002433EFEC|nr:interleukin-4 receptor subunit alpha [Sorex araneus]XP_054991570.1 interleukin-4 receptor subunit alpha [Sorex araneus]
MGLLSSGLPFPMGCLVLVWTAGAGCVEVLGEPTCVSDYLNTSTCHWGMDRATNCSAELRLSYWSDWQDSEKPENYTCVPENRASAECECILQMEEAIVASETYLLELWAGSRLLRNWSFIPYLHVKPRAPGHLLLHGNVSHAWLLTWSNPYQPDHMLYSELTYLVNITNDHDPADTRVFDVNYKDTALHFRASALRPGAAYSARVRARAPSYDSAWSDWSDPVSWQNYYEPPWEQRLQLGVSVSCTLILFVCVSCYFSILKIKKEWWDQIPSPARSPLMAIVTQDPQGSVWGKPCPRQEAATRPHWKTCLAKLLPCFLEHGQEGDEAATKGSSNGPGRGPGGSAWQPLEASRTVLWPERISVVQCVELARAEEPREEPPEDPLEDPLEEVEGSSSGAFLDSRKDIADRLTESLFLGLLGADPGVLAPPEAPPEASCPGEGRPFSSGSGSEPAAAGPACPQRPAAVSDNPAYRSFQQCLQDGGRPEDPGGPPPSCPQPPPPPEPETWQQSLQRAPPSGYRAFLQAVEQGAAQGSAVAGPAPAGAGAAGQAGYRALSSLDPRGPPGAQDSCSGGGYRPFASLAPGTRADPVPLLTFGLDLGPPPGPGHSTPLPGGGAPQPGKGAPLPEPDPEPLRGELGGGVVYSALTCHLCGHLKQCHGQEDRAKAPVVASGPCCGCCCCGDKSSPPGSPLPPESGLSSEEGGFPQLPTAPTCLSTS